MRVLLKVRLAVKVRVSHLQKVHHSRLALARVRVNPLVNRPLSHHQVQNHLAKVQVKALVYHLALVNHHLKVRVLVNRHQKVLPSRQAKAHQSQARRVLAKALAVANLQVRVLRNLAQCRPHLAIFLATVLQYHLARVLLPHHHLRHRQIIR